jgi:hypothetical protein
MLSALSKFLSRIRCIRMTISTSSSRREQSYSGKPRKLVRRATKNRYKNVFGKTFKIALADGKVSSNPARLVEQRPEKNADSASSQTRMKLEMTVQGREGMVVKPLNFIAEGRRGITQPAIKCRAQSTFASSTARSISSHRTLNGCVRGT